jgi:hypothetical protein
VKRHLLQRLAPMVLVALTLAWSAACRAEEGTRGPAASESGAVAPVPAAPDALGSDANGKPDAPDPVSPSARVHRPQVRHAPGHGIDETVRRLTRGLDLDPAQQAKLREILWDEQRQARKLRANSGAGVDWPSATATIVDQTKARIRVMLNDEQKKKYSMDVPREGLAPAQADLQHWMQLQESKRLQDNEISK